MRLITSGQDADDPRRGEHVNDGAVRPRNAGRVTSGGPAQQRIAMHGKSCAVERDEGAIRQAVDAAPVPALGAAL